jgi:DNA ligase (NAD+)
MWTPDLLNIAKDLIKKSQSALITKDDLNAIKTVINASDHSYYVLDKPVLADAEYDYLFASLKKLEQESPSLITVDSPTQRIAQGLTKDFETVPHLVPMLSLENSYDLIDLTAWDQRCKDACPNQEIHYCVEPKYDGAGISLFYENDLLARAATRGDGIRGDDITSNAKQIKSIPLQAKLSEYGILAIEIRGEVLITKDKFEKYNNLVIAQGNEPLANPRNAASGSLRMKDPNEVSKRGLDAFLYHVSYTQLADKHKDLSTHSSLLKMLEHTGFRSSSTLAKVCTNIQDVFDYVKFFEGKRDELPFEIDGMVIKVDSLAQQDIIGQTSHHPRWAMAFKFKARQATSILLSVEYQIGRTGSITPVAKIEPVFIGGVTVSSISLHNHDMILQKDIRIGDLVLVERAGDVIPYVVKSFPELRKGHEMIIEFPKDCPICKSELHKPDEEVIWRCINMECPAQVVERIIHFASKDAMDIRGLGDANIKKFFELGILKNILGVYHLPYETLKSMDGLGAKSIDKLQEAIEKSKSQPLSRLIYGLGIRYVGETTAKALAASIHHISELYSKTIDELRQLDDVGEKVAASIVDFFCLQNNKDLITDLESLGLLMENAKKHEISSDGSLNGKTFLFTGTLTAFKRSEAETKVEVNGGSILGSVSSKLNYLVVGADAGSKLEKAKKLGTVQILTEQEFLDFIP